MSINLTRIYTKGGDRGETSLADGVRIPKSHPRLDAYGTADELNSVLGMLRTICQTPEYPRDVQEFASQELASVQNDLFNAGSLMARNDATTASMPAEAVQRLEQWIDIHNSSLSPLTSFVLPGGNQGNAWAHMARTTCRRLEREIAACQAAGHAIHPTVHAWVNRLSDWLFVVSRWLSHQCQTKEFLWVPGKGSPRDA